jgi:hypothetical protein
MLGAAKASMKPNQRKEDVQTRKQLTLEGGRAGAGQEAVAIRGMSTISVERGEGEGEAI